MRLRCLVGVFVTILSGCVRWLPDAQRMHGRQVEVGASLQSMQGEWGCLQVRAYSSAPSGHVFTESRPYHVVIVIAPLAPLAVYVRAPQLSTALPRDP